MRSNRLVAAIAFAGLTAVFTIAAALEPGEDFSKMRHPTGVLPLLESPHDLTANQVVCTNDADCDDGSFCNGMETCDVGAGECLPGPGNPCTTFEGYAAPCDNDLDSCTEPDPCFTWIADTVGSGYFLPEADHCPDLASWVFDDIQGSHHTTGVLDYYTTPIIARTTPGGASPGIGTVFLVNQALFTTTSVTCTPEEEIAGSQCTGAATVDVTGSPAHNLPCSGTMPALPNNAGDFSRCEIDFFLAYRTTENGAGFAIAGDKPVLGGPAAADDFGVSVVWTEDCPPTGVFDPRVFACPGCVADFATAVVCQKPGGTCCEPDGSCALRSESDCAAVGGTYGGTGTIYVDPGSCGGDPDGDGLDSHCGDNCPNDSNPGQSDCDGDGEGDVCEIDACEQDDDRDGVCNCVDNCPSVWNPDQADRDGDGVGDACDGCPEDPKKVEPGLCGCKVPDDVDSDGDGVQDCIEKCPGVDDAVFAPDCVGAIPTTSQWGLIVLTLLLLAGGKIYFRGRSAVAASPGDQYRPDSNRD